MNTLGTNLARVSLLGLALSSSAFGTTYSWDAPAGGSFFSGGLWSPAGIPGAADRANFDLSSAYSVSFIQSFPVPPLTVTNERLRVGDDDVVFAMFARTYNLTSTSMTSLSIGGTQRGLGSADDGRLRITGGALNVQSAIIGDGGFAGLFGFGSGTLEIGAAVFNSSGALVIGQGTTGNFTVDSGGDANTSLATIGGDYNRSGTATVTGVGSTWTSDTLDVGGNSNGTLNILSGGLVHTTDVTDVYVGAAAGKTGTVTVSGSTSKWDHEGSFIIGHGGNGVLNISAGGLIEAAGFNRSTVLGNLSGSSGTATVSGANSRWAETNSNHVLVVGNQGTGSASVANGGIASFDVVRIGQHPIGGGTVDVQGTGSQWNSAFGIYVGGTEFAAGGSGALNIGPGGKVTVSALYATKIWEQGTVNLNGGTLETGRLEMMGGNFHWTSGTLYLTGNPLSIEPTGPFGDAVAIENGKHLRSIELIVGNAGNGSVAVNSGASVRSDFSFTVGRTGAGTVEVNGGLLTTDFVNQIGDQSGSEGTVTISNAGRWDVVGTVVSDFVQEGMTIATPRTMGNRLFVTGFYSGPLMIDLGASGVSPKVLWRTKPGNTEVKNDSLHAVMCTPIFVDEFVYGVGSYGDLRCLDANTGQIVWETRDATGSGRWWNAFLVPHRDRVVICNEQGEIIFAKLDPAGYHELSRAMLIKPTQPIQRRMTVWSHPAFAMHSVFARNDGELIRVNLAAP